MALRQAAQEQQQRNQTQEGKAAGGAAAGASASASARETNAILATANRTERGQRLRAVNWVKQVRLCGFCRCVALVRR